LSVIKIGVEEKYIKDGNKGNKFKALKNTCCISLSIHYLMGHGWEFYW
jgi:hypothetical protein